MKKFDVYILIALLFLIFFPTAKFIDYSVLHYFSLKNGTQVNLDSNCLEIEFPWVIESIEGNKKRYHLQSVINSDGNENGEYIFASIKKANEDILSINKTIKTIKKDDNYSIYELTQLRGVNPFRFFAYYELDNIMIVGESIKELESLIESTDKFECDTDK